MAQNCHGEQKAEYPYEKLWDSELFKSILSALCC